MAKDLTEALRALTEAGAGQTSRRDTRLPDVTARPNIPQRTGSAGPKYAATSGDSWALKGEKTMATSDGLFTIYYPETLESTIGSKVITIGAIKTETTE